MHLQLHLVSYQMNKNLFRYLIKLIALEAQIAALKEGIEAEVGELVVTLRSEDGTVSVMQNNTVNQIFAGYYVDEVAELSIKKGHIVTKTFKLLVRKHKRLHN
jgi:CII-binding regulator of phage lambda lysogenization HflD